MGKQKLCLGVFLGAVAGGLTALCDKETRSFTKQQLKLVKNTTGYYVKHPTDAIRNVQDTLNGLNQKVNANADNAINALEQVEETLNKISKKDEPKKLESTM
ncbi:YtxH domain-containing protein [Lentibacillus sp. N15]|uniref:YtxH domain-containing protein n=1 Tax=Lentibacillus songyuanensis TaxID=3136161 RepID=UPI0031BA07A3